MPKRIPSTNNDNGQWGTILNAHLAQTKNAKTGAFNSFNNFFERPNISEFTIDDIGKSYLFT